ncbi:MAG: molecular chaperone TorD family protein, partial [Gordonibacter sp.]|uniref:TorD/DmsD family molecular chaperone n=1 Tax=Gordonibacter sp. TaxID=1968902 RepID=UPI002FCAF869
CAEREQRKGTSTMMTHQELLEFFSESADTYRFLSQVFFKELNAEAIDELFAADYPDDTGNAHLDEGYRLVRRYFAFSTTDRRTQLACEYARIFLAAGMFTKESQTAVPYESVFAGEEHLMMGDARDDVVARFLEDGFQVNPDLHEPEDHLAFELEYLVNLNERASTCAQAKDKTELRRNAVRQLEFIEQHLLNWIPALHDAAQDYAKLAFYPGMLLVAQGTLEQGRDLLRAVVAQLDDTSAAA